MESGSVSLAAPMLIAGGSTLIQGLDMRTPIGRYRSAILSMIALALGSVTMYVSCSAVERILGAIDILIGAFVMAVVL